MSQATLAYINEDEIATLFDVRDLVKGYGPSFGVPRFVLLETVGGDDETLKRNLSYLAQHGLIGTNESYVADIASDVRVQSKIRTAPLNDLWLTGAGIDFIRAIEAQPNMPQKITASVIRGGSTVIVAAARIILTEWAKAQAGVYVR